MRYMALIRDQIRREPQTSFMFVWTNGLGALLYLMNKEIPATHSLQGFLRTISNFAVVYYVC